MLAKMEQHKRAFTESISYLNKGEWPMLDSDNILSDFNGIAGYIGEFANKEEYKSECDYNDTSDRVRGFYKYLQLSMNNNQFKSFFNFIKMLCVVKLHIVRNEGIHGKRRLLRTKNRARMSLENENKNIEFSENIDYPWNETLLKTLAKKVINRTNSNDSDNSNENHNQNNTKSKPVVTSSISYLDDDIDNDNEEEDTDIAVNSTMKFDINDKEEMRRRYLSKQEIE